MFRSLFAFFLLAFSAIFDRYLGQQRFAIEPADKTAIVGDTVILPCRVVNKVGTLQCECGQRSSSLMMTYDANISF